MSVAQSEVAHEPVAQEEIPDATTLTPIDPANIVLTTQSTVPVEELVEPTVRRMSSIEIKNLESTLNVHIEGALTELKTKFSFATHAFEQLKKIVRAIAWAKAHPDKEIHTPPPNLHYTTENLVLMKAKVVELIDLMDHADDESYIPVSGGSIDHIGFNIARRIMYLANKANIDEATEGLEDKFKYPNVFIGKELNRVLTDIFLRIYFAPQREKFVEWFVSVMANITACPDLVHINYEIPFNTKVVLKTDKLHRMEIYANVKQFIDENRKSEECMSARLQAAKEFKVRREEFLAKHPERIRRPMSVVE